MVRPYGCEVNSQAGRERYCTAAHGTGKELLGMRKGVRFGGALPQRKARRGLCFGDVWYMDHSARQGVTCVRAMCGTWTTAHEKAWLVLGRCIVHGPQRKASRDLC